MAMMGFLPMSSTVDARGTVEGAGAREDAPMTSVLQIAFQSWSLLRAVVWDTRTCQESTMWNSQKRYVS